MKLFLAPMEGVVDSITRDVLTRLGGIDQCVTEFIRVTDQLVPAKVFYREMPELKTDSKTASGVPVFAQILGGDPICLADNAAYAAELGACGVDLNFGCPAKTVNRHDGGAALLLYPERIYKIVRAVRAAVPMAIPVTAKIRLGFSDPSACLETAHAVEAGGASWLTVHCRTKLDMYKPPAFWEWIPRIKEKIKIPLVANGEIFTVADFQRCRAVTGCDQFMIGRGVFRDPFIFSKITNENKPGWVASGNEIDSTHSVDRDAQKQAEFAAVTNLIRDFFEINWQVVSPRFAQARTKQWLRSLAEGSEAGQVLFEKIKTVTDPEVFRHAISSHH